MLDVANEGHYPTEDGENIMRESTPASMVSRAASISAIIGEHHYTEYVQGSASSSSSHQVGLDVAHYTSPAMEPRARVQVTSLPKRPEPPERFLGVPTYQSQYYGPSGDRSYDYLQKYRPDEPGQEAGPAARVWKVYLDEAEVYDEDMIKGFRDTLDTLLIFAALFSAVVTTFAVQTAQALQPDFNQISVALLYEQTLLLRANGNATAINIIPSSSLNPDSNTTSSSDFWVNALFFTSLAISLSTALLSVLVKQWIQAYTTVTSGTAKDRALIRQFRFTGVMRWKLPEIVGILPILLHISLVAFLCGLSLFVNSLHAAISWIVIVVTGIVFVLYFGSILLPALRIDCPYRIPLLYRPSQYCLVPIQVMIILIHKLCSRIKRKLIWSSRVGPSLGEFLGLVEVELPILSRLDILSRSGSFKGHELEILRSDDSITIQGALLWLHEVSSNASVVRVVGQTANGLLDPAYRKVIGFFYDMAWKQSFQDYEISSSGIDTFSILTQACIHSHSEERRLRDHHTFMTLLNNAIESNSIYRLVQLACCGFNSSECAEVYAKSLRIAVSHGWLDAATLLTANGADVNANRGTEISPLRLASASGNLEMMNLLIKRGADVNATTETQMTVLHRAAHHGSLEQVKILIDNGADVNITATSSGTALHEAAYQGHFETVKYLIAKGADVGRECEEFGSVLDAAQRGRLEILAGYVGSKTMNHDVIVKFLKAHGSEAPSNQDAELSWLDNMSFTTTTGSVQFKSPVSAEELEIASSKSTYVYNSWTARNSLETKDVEPKKGDCAGPGI